MLSSKLLGNVLGDFGFGDDTDDVIIDNWIKQIVLPNPTLEAG